MSSIIEKMNSMLVTTFLTTVTFAVSFFMLLIESNFSDYIFIPSLFLKRQWWRIFTAPIVCSGGFDIIASCMLLAYFGQKLEQKIGSANFLKALVLGYFLIVISIVILSFISFLPVAFTGIIVGPGSLVVFLIQLCIQVFPNLHPLGLPVSIIPFLMIIFYILVNFYASALLFGLLFGYKFDSIFPDIIQVAPNDAQNMAYNTAGFWHKSPSNKQRKKFAGKPHSLND